MGFFKKLLVSFLLIPLISCSSALALFGNKEFDAFDGPESRGYVSKKEEIMHKSVVSIQVRCADGSGKAGSGAAVAKKYIVTAKHVVTCKGGVAVDRIVVEKYDGKQFIVTVYKLHPSLDAAVLQTEENQFTVHADVNTATPLVGAEWCAVSGMNHKYKCGKVSKVYKRGGVEVSTQADIFPGDSGSGYFNENGDVVAVVYGYQDYRNGDRLSIATGIFAWKEILPPEVIQTNKKLTGK